MPAPQPPFCASLLPARWHLPQTGGRKGSAQRQSIRKRCRLPLVLCRPNFHGYCWRRRAKSGGDRAPGAPAAGKQSIVVPSGSASRLPAALPPPHHPPAFVGRTQVLAGRRGCRPPGLRRSEPAVLAAPLYWAPRGPAWRGRAGGGSAETPRLLPGGSFPRVGSLTSSPLRNPDRCESRGEGSALLRGGPRSGCPGCTAQS